MRQEKVTFQKFQLFHWLNFCSCFFGFDHNPSNFVGHLGRCVKTYFQRMIGIRLPLLILFCFCWSGPSNVPFSVDCQIHFRYVDIFLVINFREMFLTAHNIYFGSFSYFCILVAILFHSLLEFFNHSRFTSLSLPPRFSSYYLTFLSSPMFLMCVCQF